MKYRIAYYWKVFSIYINLKRFFIESAAISGLFIVMSLAFREHFMLFAIPLWWLFVFLALYAKWKTTIKPNHEMILKEIELEEKYDFLYGRFTKT